MATPVAESLKRFRGQFKLKQKDVADALGVSQQAYQAYEKDSYPSTKLILKLSKIYDVTTDYLLGQADEPRPKKYDEQEVRDAFALRDMIGSVIAKQLALQPKVPA